MNERPPIGPDDEPSIPPPPPPPPSHPIDPLLPLPEIQQGVGPGVDLGAESASGSAPGDPDDTPVQPENPYDLGATTVQPEYIPPQYTPPPGGAPPEEPFVDDGSDGDDQNRIVLVILTVIVALIVIIALLWLIVVRDDDDTAANTTADTPTSAPAESGDPDDPAPSTIAGGPTTIDAADPLATVAPGSPTTAAPEATVAGATTIPGATAVPGTSTVPAATGAPATTIAPAGTTPNPCASPPGTVVTGIVAGDPAVVTQVEQPAGTRLLDIVLDAGDQIQIDVGQVDFDPQVEFRDANGDYVGANDDDPNGINVDSRLTVIASTSGFHQIVVSAIDPNLCGSFEISVTRIGTAGSPVRTPAQGSTFFDTALVTPDFTTEWIDVIAGDVLTVQVLDACCGTDPKIELYDPFGMFLGEADDNAGGLDAALTVTAQQSGMHEMRYFSTNGITNDVEIGIFIN